MSIRCWHCKADHETVAEVKRCAGIALSDSPPPGESGSARDQASQHEHRPDSKRSGPLEAIPESIRSLDVQGIKEREQRREAMAADQPSSEKKARQRIKKWYQGSIHPPPNDRELHRRIGSTQHYDEDD